MSMATKELVRSTAAAPEFRGLYPDADGEALQALAERAVGQMYLMLEEAAINPWQPLAPSPAVDEAWHRCFDNGKPKSAYLERCKTRYKRVIHHVCGADTGPDDLLVATVRILGDKEGFDPLLWQTRASGWNCRTCTPEEKCNEPDEKKG